MKKSMLNVITLALVLINLVLTVILTFSLVSTNKKTNDLISKIATIIDLDVGGGTSSDNKTDASIDDIAYIDITNNDKKEITISYIENGKTRYAVLTVSLGLNSKAKDYDSVSKSVNNGMKVIVNKIESEAYEYTFSTITTNKSK